MPARSATTPRTPARPATQATQAAQATPARFRPVRTRRAFEAVCEQVRLQVAEGTLRPGQRLPGERELAAQFDISRSGVREALRSLELAGVVQARTGSSGGFFIRSGDGDGVTQAVRDMVALGQVPTAMVTEARIELTCVAVRLACRRATAAELDAIEADIEHHAMLFREGRASRNVRAVNQFYRLLAQATHNDVIVMMVDALSELLRTLLARIDPQPLPALVPLRRKVLRHLRERDADAACAVMTAYLRKLHRYLEDKPWVQEAPAPARKARGARTPRATKEPA